MDDSVCIEGEKEDGERKVMGAGAAIYIQIYYESAKSKTL